MYFNARSLIPKFDELCLLVETHQPDIVCIVETWLDHDISDNESYLPGFQLYRLDRNHHGGGILMYAQHNLIVNVLPSNNVPHNLEFLPISVRHNHFKVGIANFISHPVLLHLFMILLLRSWKISMLRSFVILFF